MKQNCLIIEDSVMIREIYRICLENTNFNVIAEVSNGNEALDVAKFVNPDLILLDLVLPGMNGFDVLALLTSHVPKAKVIIVTSLNDEDFKIKAKSLGAVAFLEKPFRKEQLINTLTDVGQIFSGVENG